MRRRCDLSALESTAPHCVLEGGRSAERFRLPFRVARCMGLGADESDTENERRQRTEPDFCSVCPPPCRFDPRVFLHDCGHGADGRLEDGVNALVTIWEWL